MAPNPTLTGDPALTDDPAPLDGDSASTGDPALAGDPTLAGWRNLAWELDQWAARGATATLWWRDDDATTATPALGRLFELSRTYGAPLALATIPALADDALATAVATAAESGGMVCVVQHGYAHLNHAPPSVKKAEFNDFRPLAEQEREIGQGRALLATRFGAHFRPVFVPPWNRFPATLAALLAGCGIVGLSTFKARVAAHPSPGIIQVNTHVDPIDWRGSRHLAEAELVLAQAVDHLRARRTGGVDADEPTGLLTHHLVHGEDVWGFVATFLATISAHPAARWLSLDEAFSWSPSP